jgi:hypothetical protein
MSMPAKTGSIMFPKPRSTLAASTLLIVIALLTGCASEDRRLVADEQSCRSMGHVDGTPEFRQCMNDLNERRCATRKATKQGGSVHEATTDCTRLGP